jgi:hypothetical protein
MVSRAGAAKGTAREFRGNSLSDKQCDNNTRYEREVVDEAPCEWQGSDQEARHNEAAGDKQCVAEKFQLLSRRMAMNRSVDRQAARNAPTMPGRLMRSASMPATVMTPSIVTK